MEQEKRIRHIKHVNLEPAVFQFYSLEAAKKNVRQNIQ